MKNTSRNLKLYSMKIVNKKPWWWILTGAPWTEECVTTLGSTIYCMKENLEEETIVHEMVHIQQCNGSYLKSIWFAFRDIFDREHYFQAELEAYKAQMKFLISLHPDLEHQIKQHIIKKMSHEIYGFDKEKVLQSFK